MTEPNYFERDRYDLPLPLIGVNPNLIVGAPVLESSISHSMSEEQKRLQQQSIAQALNQILSSVGVRFKFSLQHHPQTQVSTVAASPSIPEILPLEYRLWVRCHAPTSLDCQLIAAPLARALRHLELQGCQDAIVEFSQSGTPTAATKGNSIANWRLKIDLTPPSVRLRHWARWGDVQAISKLLNFALAPEGIQMSAILKDLTLQIFCTSIDPQVARVPARKIAIETISPLLLELTPQGIQGATIHGMSTVDGCVEEPHVWMHWLDLPALGNPKFSPTPIILAARGDLAALNFVLERLLNPDLEQCFELGGIGIFLLQRGRLLHVMSEAAICPIQSQVATTVVKVLRQLALGIRGVRVHGRISGQLRPLWSYGVDFEREPLELPPVVPEERFVADEPSLTKIGLGQRISDRLVATGIWKPQYTLVKSSQLVYQPRFKWEPSILLLLVGIGLAIVSDLSVKFALESKHVTAHSIGTATPISFNNPLLDRKLAQYKQLCQQQGVPDILIVGSSRALRGINPEVLRNGLLSPEYNNPTIYNFGINGATAQVIDSILRQLLTAQQLPKMVIWADGARAFNSGRADRTYETIALSDGYRHLSLTSGLTNSSLPFLQAQSSFQNTYQAIDNRIDLGLANISPAYYHRDRIKAWMQARVPFADLSLDSSDPLHHLDPGASISDREINPDGFLALELQFEPATYYQKYHKVTGYSDGDYANFQLLGTQDRALKQVINLLAARKIPLIFVNMPLSDIYLDKIRSQHEITFQQYMQKLMDSQQLTFLDLNGMLAKQYSFFSDPSHLNQLGASEVSNYLVKTPLISSQVSKSNIVVGN